MRIQAKEQTKNSYLIIFDGFQILFCALLLYLLCNYWDIRTVSQDLPRKIKLFFPHTACDLFQTFGTKDSERECMLCRCFHTYSGSELEKGNAAQCRRILLTTGPVQGTPRFQPAPILLHSRSSNASREQQHTGPQGGTTAWPLSNAPFQHGKKNDAIWTFWERALEPPGYKFPVEHHCLCAKCPSVSQAGLESCACLLFETSSLSWYCTLGRWRNIYLTGCPRKSPPWGTEEKQSSTLQSKFLVHREPSLSGVRKMNGQSSRSPQDPGTAKLKCLLPGQVHIITWLSTLHETCSKGLLD